MTSISENEWPLDDDGFPHRQAARVVVFDDAGHTFLTLGHDIDDGDHAWWFTVGGGLESGESLREGAARELREETGLRIEPDRLEGPVLYREATFYFTAVTRKQDEYFFLLRVSAAERCALESPDRGAWTELERAVLDEQRWWDLAELERAEASGRHAIYPRRFVEMAREWVNGWNGELIHVVED